MQRILRVAILLTVVMFGSSGLANAQEFLPAVWVDVSEVEGLTADGLIPEPGTDLVIPVRFKNVNDPRTAISNGYGFVGEVAYGSLAGAWNPAYPWNWELAFPIGCFPPACYPFFDQGTFINYFPGGVGFAGLTGANGSGLPADFDDIAYFITLTGVSGAPGETLVMDSTWWPPANFWLWSWIADEIYWGGPYEFEVEGIPCCCNEVYTTCWPQPSVLKSLENDRILNFSVFCEDVNSVVLESMRVGNIPPYTGARVEGDSVVTDAFIMRFLGASGFRPVPSEGIQSTYTLTYDKTDGSSVSLVGDFVLTVYQGDVNFDTDVTIEDVILLTDYLFHDSGQKAELFGYEMDECMDVDASGRFDLLDIQATLQITGL